MLQEKRAKRMCFKCDEKWGHGHRCRRKELSVLLLDDLEDDEPEGELATSEPPTSSMEDTPIEVSLNSVIGWSWINPKTIKRW